MSLSCISYLRTLFNKYTDHLPFICLSVLGKISKTRDRNISYVNVRFLSPELQKCRNTCSLKSGFFSLLLSSQTYPILTGGHIDHSLCVLPLQSHTPLVFINRTGVTFMNLYFLLIFGPRKRQARTEL